MYFSFLLKPRAYFFENKFTCGGREVAAFFWRLLIHKIWQSNDINSHWRHFNAKFIHMKAIFYLMTLLGHGIQRDRAFFLCVIRKMKCVLSILR